MEWIEAVKDIIDANENNRLVIFVGSGVSANSNIPTWKDLIEKMARKIEYINESDENKDISSTDFLKIAEYFYLSDGSSDKHNYYNFIKEQIGGDYAPNPIDDMILKILPHHIITTNYDKLIENSKEINSNLFSVITKDDDLLTHNNDHYIIKMHGDIENIEHIVLKESDYLKYEQSHALISTYIKSLLIDHSFLFIGYSLNDYNLKLIINWINYFCELYDVKNRPKNYIVQSNKTYEYEEKRLNNSNIFVVDSRKISKNVSDKVKIPNSLESSIGKDLYCFLYCIYDSNTIYDFQSFVDALEEKYSLFESYNKISHIDLLKLHKLKKIGNAEVIGKKLITDKEYFYKIVNAIKSSDKVRKTFEKSGIVTIYSREPEELSSLEYTIENNNKFYNNDKLFEFYIENDYNKLLENVKKIENIAPRIYYLLLLCQNKDVIDDLLSEAEKLIDRNDIVSVLLHKSRKYLALFRFNYNFDDTNELTHTFASVPKKYSIVIDFLNNTMLNSDKYSYFMQYNLNKLIERYETNNHTLYFFNVNNELYKIQAYVYDYYEFFKFNHLPIDYYSNPKRFFSYYVEAIMVTYSPKSYFEEKSNIFGYNNNFEPYALNIYDLDILIKYTNKKTLTNLINKYKVDELIVTKDINIANLFSNFCSSFGIIDNQIYFEQLEIFSIIISKININEKEKNIISEAILNLVFKLLDDNNMNAFDHLLPALFIIIEHNFNDNYKNELLKRFILPIPLLFQEKFNFNKRSFIKIINLITKNVSPDNQNLLTDYINKSVNGDDEEFIDKIYIYRNVLDKKIKVDFFNKRIDRLSLEKIFYLLIEGVLNYNEYIENKFLNTLDDILSSEKFPEGIEVHPNPLHLPLELATILCILDGFMDIEKLKKYSDYSVYIQFMLNPKEFDYSNVDIGDYMWSNLIYSEKYSKYFPNNKNKILTDKLEQRFKKEIASLGEQKIVFGKLLADDELNGYAK